MKKKEFEYWLKSYKEFNAGKASNVSKRLDEFSDFACGNRYIDKPVFSNATFVQLAKWRQIVARHTTISNSLRKDLDLFSEYLEIKEITNLSYDLPETNRLSEYVENMKMSYSYKAVLILILLERMRREANNNIDNIVEDIINYYVNRIDAGLVAEKNDSIFCKCPIGLDEAKKVIINNPMVALEKAGVLLHDEGRERIVFSSEFYIENEDVELAEASCKRRLEAYYDRISSNKNAEITPEKKLEMAILNIASEEDKVRCLRAYRECFGETDNHKSMTGTRSCLNNLYIQSTDQRKIGKLVQESLSKLSESGYEFEDIEYEEMFTKEWSKNSLGLYYALFKPYDPTLPIEQQTKDYRNNNRYYQKIYTFGKHKILLTSEWYKESREKFISWFNSLVVKTTLT